MLKKKEQRVVWYAKGGGVACTGPFETQAAAAAALRITPRPTPKARTVVRDLHIFPPDAFVWPEYE